MARESAGLLLYRRSNKEIEFLLVHPGGPFWKNKDAGVWTIPKGEIEAGEDGLATAKREFAEELGFEPIGTFMPLHPVRQKSGKIVQAWAFEGDCDPTTCKSNLFQIEWPPHSGKRMEFPEVDRAAFFTLDAAREKLNPAQISFLEELVSKIAS